MKSGSFIGSEGCVVRAGESMQSPFVEKLAKGTIVFLATLRGNRMQITTPSGHLGWASVCNQEGDLILAKAAEPELLCCPITKAMLRDPVVVPRTGYTYERSALHRFWQTTKSSSRDQPWPRDPMTNVQLPDTTMVPNIQVRLQVQAWLQENPERVPDGWNSRDIPPPPALSAEGGRFCGFSIGEKICAMKSVRKGEIKKGDIGIFKGPIKPYDRAVAEGLCEVVWDSKPEQTFHVQLNYLAALDKRCVILRRALSEKQSNGIFDEALEQLLETLSEATESRERHLEQLTLAAVEKLSHSKSWAPEERVSDRVMVAVNNMGREQLHESVLGPLRTDTILKTIKYLVKCGILEKTSEHHAMIGGLPIRARLLRLSCSPRAKTVVASAAAAVCVVVKALQELLDDGLSLETKKRPCLNMLLPSPSSARRPSTGPTIARSATASSSATDGLSTADADAQADGPSSPSPPPPANASSSATLPTSIGDGDAADTKVVSASSASSLRERRTRPL
ncbi:U-box domain-containing protein 36 [Diplonema papillatum]|nr:U-box domain-containing protein 36 [Diplonema papillatum]